MAATLRCTVRFVVTVGLVIAASAPAGAATRGAIETPAYLSNQAGIALISGWNCSGRKIQIRIDDGPLQTAGAHTSREDTRPTCGRADTGFGLLMNFNLLPAGRHRMVAYADGTPFAEQTFSTIRIGNPAVNGDVLRFPLLNFPQLGKATIVQWDRELQNFRADAVQSGPSVAGDYYGATTRSDCSGVVHEVRHATYSVTYDKGLMGVTIRYPDGATMTFPPTPASLRGDGHVAGESGDWWFSANGQVLHGGVRPPLDDPSCFLVTEVAAAK